MAKKPTKSTKGGKSTKPWPMGPEMEKDMPMRGKGKGKGKGC